MATTNKYDRQLRLWGSTGQKLLSECCVILVNASTCGTETLKNLVLPGIRSFHVIDDAVIHGNSQEKPFSNFFVLPPKEETSRAQIATEFLSELNADVKGSFTHVPSLSRVDFNDIIQNIVRKNGNGKVLVIGADLPPSISKALSQVCWGLPFSSSSLPLLLIRSYGLIGSVRVQTSYHPVIESRPDNTKPDLRLAHDSSKFTELHEYAKSIDLNLLDNQEHGHIPYVVILLKALEKWRDEFANGDGTKIPTTPDEKIAFRQIIKSMSRNWNNEVNFQEADENAYLVYTVDEIPYETQELLLKAEERLNAKTSKLETVNSFDVLLVSLKRFIDHKAWLPLNGSIPDMTSSSELYINLQALYKKKAEDDKMYMQKIVQDVLSEKGLPITITNEDVGTLCKNLFNIELVQTRSFFDELTNKFSNDDEKEQVLEDIVSLTYEPYEVPDHTPLLWYIALRACDFFYEKHGHYPGKDNRSFALESDTCELQRHIEDVVNMLSLEANDFIKSTLLDKDKAMAHAKEMTRYFNADVHNIASVIGGVASQEGVKLITSQFIPLNSTYIYNGIVSVGSVIKI